MSTEVLLKGFFAGLFSLGFAWVVFSRYDKEIGSESKPEGGQAGYNLKCNTPK